jgi:mannose-6-phosphate isomerase-like protein (cupin superfamily)
VSHYTKKNIRDLDNSAEQFGLAPDLEARFGRKAVEARRGGFSYQKLAPGFRPGFGHRHKEQEEIYIVLSGSGRAKVNDDIVDLHEFDALRVDPDAWRGFEAGDEGLEFLVFGAGESGDAETSDDFWPKGE